MITELLVIEQIDVHGKVTVFQIMGEYLQWTFQTGQTKKHSDADFFPFQVFEEKRILKRPPGAETKCVVNGDEIIFCDDYGVRGGSVIAVLFPPNYIPDIIKFKDKPFIPTGFAGLVSTTPPGQIQVLYNHLEKRSAIVFNIHHQICFGFKCIAKKVEEGSFPRNESMYADNFFDLTISRDFLKTEAITNEDLKIINKTVDSMNLDNLKNDLNELLQLIKNGKKEDSTTLLNKISSFLVSGMGTTSNLITITDSYKAGGVSFEFIHKILQYANL
ncbi:hypothetical protein [Mucilaginibacter sp. UYCu711]|uniref:hypothetical protein n=1 Tax=Mucilaginibacter sp. UYCu711 TaxID=3156339 RepID=UPI003D1CB16F